MSNVTRGPVAFLDTDSRRHHDGLRFLNLNQNRTQIPCATIERHDTHMSEQSRCVEFLLGSKDVLGVEESVLLQVTCSLDELFSRSSCFPRRRGFRFDSAVLRIFDKSELSAACFGIRVCGCFDRGIGKTLFVVMSHQPRSSVIGLRRRIEISFLDFQNRAQFAFW